MIEKSKLKKYANNLMFEMNDKEYDTLQQEFETMLKQIDIIGTIENLEEVEPMTFPYKLEDVNLRDDTVARCIDNEAALANCHAKKGRDVKVPRVVE